MKKVSLLAAIAACGVLTACSQYNDKLERPFGSGVPYSAEERALHVHRNVNMEGRMLVDDIDMILMVQPLTRLHPWAIR